MKARVIVRLKEGVLDPQGQTIQRSLSKLGHREVTRVRQGKFFELEIDGPQDREQIRQKVDEIARQVLSNPIIEQFEIEEIQ